MAGNASRNKGANAEREVINMLQPIVDKVYAGSGLKSPLLERNTLQCNKGGSDVAGLPWLALEIKRQETENLNKWWEQTVLSTQLGQYGVLIHRGNRGKWKVRMHGALLSKDQIFQTVVDINLDSFLVWFQSMVENELTELLTKHGMQPKVDWPPAPPKD